MPTTLIRGRDGFTVMAAPARAACWLYVTNPRVAGELFGEWCVEEEKYRYNHARRLLARARREWRGASK